MSGSRVWQTSRQTLRQRFLERHPYRCFSCSFRLAQEQTQSAAQQQSSSAQNDRTTHFGFETVLESAKEAKVKHVFSSVAASYDTMNDLMSLGIHRLWKDSLVRSLNPGSPPTSEQPANPWTILDIAGGTGDIAFRLLDHATLVNNDHTTRVIISDINPAMLAEGKKRSLETPYAGTTRLAWLEANAEELDAVESNSIDLYTVAFGIRNFTSKSRALAEAFRVLKPGGVFACLEFSKVHNQLFNNVYKRWSFGAIPLIGQLVAGDRESYQYLVESIERFPDQEGWTAMIKEAGFMVAGRGWEDMTGGVAAVHKGVKPVR